MIVGGAILALVAWAGADANSPAVWIVPSKGPLIRAARDGDAQLTFDLSPKLGSLLFRNRELAFIDGRDLTWVKSGSSIARSTLDGKTLLGWRDGEPLLSDGKDALTLSELKIQLSLHEGDTPLFASLTDKTGLVVAETSSGTLRVSLIGPHVFAADFGRWALVGARMLTSASGYLLLSGSGSAVVRIAKGRAEIVSIDSQRQLGIGIASDGTFYITRPAHDDDTDKDLTEVLELADGGKLNTVCTVAGTCDLVDLDRGKKLLFVVRHAPQTNAYIRFNYSLQQEDVLGERVLMVVPAFGGPGFLSANSIADAG